MHIIQTCYLDIYHIEMFHIFQFLFFKWGMLSIIVLSVVENTQDCHTGGSRLSCTVAKPDSHLARIFVAKFFCIN